MSKTLGVEAMQLPVEQRLPRLGFLGVGWIGRLRLESIARSGAAQVVGIADVSPELCRKAAQCAPKARLVSSLPELLDMDLDGVVIATPNALHPRQCVQALERGVAVFCQKPLARTAAETAAIVDAAKAADRLLGVDLSYRHLEGIQKIRALKRLGALGDCYAAELVFHNAYGPDKPWFYDINQAGGGCVLDLGIHLVDLGMWMFDFPKVTNVSSRLYQAGVALSGREASEDYAEARIDLEGGASLRVACSWKLHAGRDAVIEAAFYGTQGAAALTNVDGSFVDFKAEHYQGRECHLLAQPPEEWGGRAVLAWTRQLAFDPRFDPQATRLVEVAKVLDAIYEQG